MNKHGTPHVQHEMMIPWMLRYFHTSLCQTIAIE